MDPSREYAAASIGAAAYSVWNQAQSATIIGVTSRGLFLRFAPDRVLFLSYESQRGPLTITLPPSLLSAPAGLRALSPGAPSPLSLRPHSGGHPALGDRVQFSTNRLFFSSIEVTLSVSEDAIWRAPIPTTPMLSPEAVKATLRSIAAEIVAQRHVESFGALLVPLLDRSAPPLDDQAMLFAELASLQASLTQQSPHTADDAIKLLGRGQGLTPSGDDSVLGVLLMLNRSRVYSSLRGGFTATKQSSWLSDFNQRLITAAYQKTTTLSANLIECAANGEADERLIAVVDGVLTGEPSMAECVARVLDWGNSSGIDALVGMALACLACHSEFVDPLPMR